MNHPGTAIKAALRSPLLPFWLVIALLPFGRSAELGTFLCLLGVLMLFVRDPQALQHHAGARLLLWLLAAYVMAALISAIDAIMPGKSWSTVAALLRYVPLGLYACFAIRRESRLHALYTAVAAVLAVWCLDAWVQAFTGWSLGGHAEAVRVSGIFGAENLKLGPTLAVLSPFALWAARRRWGVPGLLVAFLLVLGPVLLAGSRAAWLCYGLVTLAFAWREARSALRFVGLCAIGALLLSVAVGVAWRTSPRFHERMDRTLLILHGTDQSIDTALSGRLDIWHDSVAMVAAHPINGVGVRGFRYAYPQYAPRGDHFVVSAEACGLGQGACHAHQLVLEILTETGFVGLLLWLLGAVVAWRAWRGVSVAARARAFPATVALVVMVFPLNTHLAFYSAWWGLLFAWLLGLWCAALFVTETRPPQQSPVRLPDFPMRQHSPRRLKMGRESLSVVVTAFNSAATLDACLRSVTWADEIVVLDSGSTDATLAIAAHYHALIRAQPFAGYSAQKQAAIDLATHRWVLLLDSDEAVTAEGAAVLENALVNPTHVGFQVWRREWQFWRWQSARSRLNHYVRLFDRERARMSGHDVHESVLVDGSIGVLDVILDHYGEADIAGRVAKANRYSSLQLADLERRGAGALKLRMVTYSTVAFLRYYVLRGHYRSGWAGFIAARIHAFYAFLKYAKLHEQRRRQSSAPEQRKQP